VLGGPYLFPPGAVVIAQYSAQSNALRDLLVLLCCDDETRAMPESQDAL